MKHLFQNFTFKLSVRKVAPGSLNMALGSLKMAPGSYKIPVNVNTVPNLLFFPLDC